MAFTKIPTDLIPSWSYASNAVTFPIASVPELSAAEVHPTTGDPRKIMFALCERMADFYNDLAVADRPTKVTVSKSSSALSDGTYQNTYQFTFRVGVLTQEVIDEA